MIKQRRLLLKSSVASGTIAVAASAGLLVPQTVLAKVSRDAFMASSMDVAIDTASIGGATESADIKIKAPDIAENGAVVPVTVSTTIADVESIAVFADKNPQPLISFYEIGSTTLPFVSQRIKMGKTGNVVAIVKAGGKTYSAKKEVKVTIGGCGG